MSGFRPKSYRVGDRRVLIAGELYNLRLSVSGLAEMASVFQADTPTDLAARLRTANLAEWNRVWRIIATPSPPILQDAEMRSVMPEISALITHGLRV